MAKFDWSKYKVVDPKNIPQQQPFDWSKYQTVPQSSSGGLLSDLGHFAQGAVQGVSDLGQGIASLGDRGINALLGTHLSAPQGDVFALNPQGANTVSAKLGNMAGQTAAMVALPEFAGESLPAKVAEGSAQGAGLGAANASAANQPLGLNAAIGGALGGAGSLVGNTLGGYLDNLAGKAAKPGSIMRSPAEAAQYMKAAGDTPVDFGSLINQPSSAKLYNNVLKYSPLSKVADKQTQLVGKNEASARNVLNNLLGDNNEADIQDNLVDAIRNNYNRNRANASAQYQSIFDDANTRGIQASHKDNTVAAIQKVLDEDNNPMNLDRLPDSISRSLKQNINKVGQPTTEGSESDIQSVHYLSSQLGNLAHDAKMRNENNLARKYLSIKNGVDQDLVKNLENSGASDLVNRLNAAKANYQQTVAPYMTRSINNLLTGKSNNQRVSNLLTGSQYGQVLSDLTPNQKNLVAYDLLKKAKVDKPEGGTYVSPQKLQSEYQKLHPQVKQAVLSNEIQNNLNKAAIINNLSRYATPAVHTPPTGLQGADNILSAGKLAAPFAIGATAAVAPHLAMPALASGAGATTLAKLLGSDALKNAYINPATSNLLRASRGLGALRYPIISGLTNRSGEQQ